MSDERGGKYLKEARFFLVGDKAAAQSHIPDARNLLGQIRDSCSHGGPETQVRYGILRDGTTIKAVKMGALYQAVIRTLSPPPEVTPGGVGIFLLRPVTTVHATIAYPDADGGTTNTDICFDPCEGQREHEHDLWGNTDWYVSRSRVVSYIRPQSGFIASGQIYQGETRYAPLPGVSWEADYTALRTYSKYLYDNNERLEWVSDAYTLTCGITVYEGAVFVVKYVPVTGLARGLFRVYRASTADEVDANGLAYLVGTSGVYDVNPDFCVKFNASGNIGVLLLTNDSDTPTYLQVTLSGEVGAFSVSFAVQTYSLPTDGADTNTRLVALDYRGDELVSYTKKVTYTQATTSTSETTGSIELSYCGSFNNIPVYNGSTTTTTAYNSVVTTTTDHILDGCGTVRHTATATTTSGNTSTATAESDEGCLNTTTVVSSGTTVNAYTRSGFTPQWYDLRPGVLILLGDNDSYAVTSTSNYTTVNDVVISSSSTVSTAGSRTRSLHTQVMSGGPAQVGPVYTVDILSSPTVESLAYTTTKGKAFDRDGVFIVGFIGGLIVVTLCDGMPRDVTASVSSDVAMCGIGNMSHCGG